MHVPSLKTIWRGTILTVRIALAVALAALLISKLAGRYRLAKARVAFAKAYGSAEPSAWATSDDLEHDNAARLLRAGVFALRIGRAERETLLHASRSPDDWTDAQRRGLAELVERNRVALAMFHEAADLSLSVYGSRCAADDSSFPFLWTREASHLLAIEAQLSYERGDRVAALHSVRAITRLASSLEGEGPMINYMVGVAVESDGMQPLFHWAQRGGRGEAAFLASVDAAVPSLDLIAQLRRARGFEALCFGIDSMNSRSETGAGVLFFWPIVELTQAELLQVATRGARLINTDVPLVERVAVLDQDSASALWGIGTALDMLAGRQLLHAALQVRMLGLKNGAYPSARPDLDPLNEPEPISGQPLVYSVQDDGTAVVTYVDATLQLKNAVFKPQRITLPRIG